MTSRSILILGMIEHVGRHVAISGKGFSRKNDFTRFCPADQLFVC